MIHWAERYLGLPWLTGGRGLASGFDCWGLLRYVYLVEYGILLSEYAAPIGQQLKGLPVPVAETANRDWIETAHPQDGDAVAMGRGALFSHVGVYLGLPIPCVLHAHRNSLSCIVELKVLQELGWDNFKFYRHAERPFYN